MPFIRHTRDKKGYETTYVMHAYRPQPGPQRTRILYLFRSPSHVKMGRRALDDEAREALEHTHPDVSFDWYALGSESTMARAEPPSRDRQVRHRRPDRPSASHPAPRPVPVILDDQSVLGRVVGAEEAARLRARYADLVQRVQRRCRTPEDRDRLIERAHRLNPDDWGDEAAVRASVAQVDAQWDAVIAELPARRRGRRGGRRRPDGDIEASSGLSVIIGESGGSDDAVPEGMDEAGDRPDPGSAPDDGGLGPEPGTTVPRDS